MKRMMDLPLEQRMELYDQAMKIRREKGWGDINIGRVLGINQHTVDNWLFRDSKPDGLFKFPDLNPSAELSYVLGTYYGDGYAYRSKKERSWFIKLEAMDKDFVEEFSRCLSKVLRKKNGYPVHRLKKGGIYFTRVTNIKLYEFLKKKSLDVHKHWIEEFPAEFLRGFYDSEGGMYGNTLGLSNTNLELLQYVRDLLERHFSIPSRIGIAHKKGVTHFYRGRKITATKDCYYLRIKRRESQRKFHEKMGFSIARKQEKLKKAVEGKVEKTSIGRGEVDG